MMIDTPMGEYLTVEGRGSTRQDALDDADRQALQYFGEDASLERAIGQATPSLRRVGGEVTLWTVDADYRRSDGPALRGSPGLPRAVEAVSDTTGDVMSDLEGQVLAAIKSWPNATWLVLPGPTDLAPGLARHIAASVSLAELADRG